MFKGVKDNDYLYLYLYNNLIYHDMSYHRK